MIRSMTGYGKGTASRGGAGVTVEVRSVNGRQREIRCRLPPPLVPLEASVRERVAASVARGRVDVTVTWEPRGAGATSHAVNVDTARAMAEAWRELQAELGLADGPTVESLLRLPGVVEASPAAEPDLEQTSELLLSAADEAVAALVAAREREGRELAADIGARVDAVAALVGSLRGRLDGAAGRQADALRERVAALLGDVALDEARLAQEVAYLAQRADASEELVRLDAHVGRLHALLARGGGAIGRELEFVVQEMRREINTLGVKASDASVDEDVLAAKTELERIREQAANVE